MSSASSIASIEKVQLQILGQLHTIQTPKKSIPYVVPQKQPQMLAQTPPHTFYIQSRSTPTYGFCPGDIWKNQPIRGSHLALVSQPSNRPKTPSKLYTAQPYTPSKSSNRPAESSTSTSTSTPTFTDTPKLARKFTNIRQYTHKRRKEGKRTNGHTERILRLLLRLLVVTWLVARETAKGWFFHNTMEQRIIWLYCIIDFVSLALLETL